MIGEFLVSHPNVELICIGLAVFVFVVWFIVRRAKRNLGVYNQVPQPPGLNYGYGKVPNRLTLDVNVNLRLGKTARGMFKDFNFEDRGTRFDS